jgi:hypothetical protein
MRTYVKMRRDDVSQSDWKNGETGYIDGYCCTSQGTPYIAVVLGNRVVLAPFYAVEVIENPELLTNQS